MGKHGSMERVARRHRWLGPTERERQRAALEDAATQILKMDRQRRNRVSSPPVKRPEPLPVTENGWGAAWKICVAQCAPGGNRNNRHASATRNHGECEMEMTAEMSDAELHQATIDMNAEDIIEHARDFFACFDGLTEFKVVLLDNGVVQI